MVQCHKYSEYYDDSLLKQGKRKHVHLCPTDSSHPDRTHSEHYLLYESEAVAFCVCLSANHVLFSVQIRPYMECAGQYLEEYQWEPCTGTSFPLSPSVTIPLSSTLSTTSNGIIAMVIY